MKLIRVRRKHNDNYYIYETEEEFQRIALAIFREGDELNYYFEPSHEKPEKPEKPDPCPEWAETAYRKEMEKYTRRLQRWREEQYEWALVEKARQGDQKAAVELLQSRQGYEYENWTIEALLNVEPESYWKYTPAEQDRRYFALLKRIFEDHDESAFEEVDALEEEMSQTVKTRKDRIGEEIPEWDRKYGNRGVTFTKGARVIRNTVRGLTRHYRNSGMDKVLDRAPVLLSRPVIQERMEMLELSLTED